LTSLLIIRQHHQDAGFHLRHHLHRPPPKCCSTATATAGPTPTSEQSPHTVHFPLPQLLVLMEKKKYRRTGIRGVRRRRCGTPQQDVSDSSYLPIEIIANILIRLPSTKDIVRCMRVCKSWRQLLTSPYFAKLHSPMAQQCLLFRRPRLRRTSQRSKRNMLPLTITTTTTTTCADHDAPTSPPVSLDVGPKFFHFHIPKSIGVTLGSCNGLLCCAHEPDASGESPGLRFVVCNPITGEYVLIESLAKRRLGYPGYPRGMEFFYCPSSDQYKIMVFFRDPQQVSLPMIYTLGSNLWRTIEHIQFPMSPSTSFNGALHWVCADYSLRWCDSICAFDIENESVRLVIPVPPQIKGNVYARHLNVSLCRGWLSLSMACRDNTGLDIWIMKEYGEVSSWTKQHVVLSPTVLRRSLKVIPIIGSTSKRAEEDDKFFLFSEGKDPSIMLSYNLWTNKAQEVEVDVNLGKHCLAAVPYTPSLLSLGHIFGGKSFTILK
ncbi:hypothetical protein Tsubulata_026428, partial [Turnera subulata]